jgi:hypothetical protein
MLAWWLRYRETGHDATGSMQAGKPEGPAMDITTRHQGAQS